MPFNYDLDIELHARVLTARRKRKPRYLAFTEVLLAPIKYLWTRAFYFFYYTRVYSQWSSITTYVRGSVIRKGYQVYESKVDGNLNNTPQEGLYWRRIQTNWIGAFTRSKIRGGKIALEKYLNDFFETDFNYPSSANEIYIETNDESIVQFVVSSSDQTTAQVTNVSEASVYFVASAYTAFDQNSFTVYIPTALWTTIDTTDAKRESLVKGILDNYVPAGIQYNVTDY